LTNIKWQYADHWRTVLPQGPINQFASRREMDRFIKRLSAVGFTACARLRLRPAPDMRNSRI